MKLIEFSSRKMGLKSNSGLLQNGDDDDDDEGGDDV